MVEKARVAILESLEDYDTDPSKTAEIKGSGLRKSIL
jgi:hypothetical protein